MEGLAQGRAERQPFGLRPRRRLRAIAEHGSAGRDDPRRGSHSDDSERRGCDDQPRCSRRRGGPGGDRWLPRIGPAPDQHQGTPQLLRGRRARVPQAGWRHAHLRRLLPPSARIAGSTLRKGAGGSRGGGESGVAAEWRAIANRELYYDRSTNTVLRRVGIPTLRVVLLLAPRRPRHLVGAPRSAPLNTPEHATADRPLRRRWPPSSATSGPPRAR